MMSDKNSSGSKGVRSEFLSRGYLFTLALGTFKFSDHHKSGLSKSLTFIDDTLASESAGIVVLLAYTSTKET